MNPRVLVLAAGASTRLGEPKALARIGGRTALEHLVGAASHRDSADAPAASVPPSAPNASNAHGTRSDGRPLVVVGRHALEIPSALDAHLDVEWVECAEWSAGRTASLTAGARAAGVGRDLLVAPVDVPLVTRGTFGALRRAWAAAGRPARGWLAPRIETPGGPRHGHPIVLGRDLARALVDLPPGTPLRALRSLADPLLDTPVTDSAVLDDLDTPDDLDRLRQRFGGGRNA